MMGRYKGYWISGDALAGPAKYSLLGILGSVLNDGRLGSIVEVVRIQAPCNFPEGRSLHS
jgi:hypothetical protein